MSAKAASAARKRASGACRNRRRRQDERLAGWVRPLMRAFHALNAAHWLMMATYRTTASSERCAHRRPTQASRKLQEASGCVTRAYALLSKAARELEAARDQMARAPEGAWWTARDMVEASTRQWGTLLAWLGRAEDEVVALQQAVREGLENGTLVPEREPGDRRPRIIVAPRPVPVRAFLELRASRVVDRIAPLLRRRRRARRPASLRVPRAGVLGRAPPLFSLSAL